MKKIKEQYKKLPDGKYEYTPKEKIMFGKGIEEILQRASDKVKEGKK